MHSSSLFFETILSFFRIFLLSRFLHYSFLKIIRFLRFSLAFSSSLFSKTIIFFFGLTLAPLRSHSAFLFLISYFVPVFSIYNARTSYFSSVSTCLRGLVIFLFSTELFQGALSASRITSSINSIASATLFMVGGLKSSLAHL